jgi:hypothetical protein
VLFSFAVTEDLGCKIIANNGNLIILVALERLVGDWVDVHGRFSWLSGQKTKLLAKFFLKIIVKILLTTEEDDATLGDY